MHDSDECINWPAHVFINLHYAQNVFSLRNCTHSRLIQRDASHPAIKRRPLQYHVCTRIRLRIPPIIAFVNRISTSELSFCIFWSFARRFKCRSAAKCNRIEDNAHHFRCFYSIQFAFAHRGRLFVLRSFFVSN